MSIQTCTRRFIAPSLGITPNWNEPRCPSTGESISEAMECYSAVRRHGVSWRWQVLDSSGARGLEAQPDSPRFSTGSPHSAKPDLLSLARGPPLGHCSATALPPLTPCSLGLDCAGLSVAPQTCRACSFCMCCSGMFFHREPHWSLSSCIGSLFKLHIDTRSPLLPMAD